jgi:hypothetical protein
MGWSAERKREERAKQKKQRLAKNDELGAQMLQNAPPMKKLKTPYKKKDLGKVCVDYGGHQKALNFYMEKGVIQVHLAKNGDWLEEDSPSLASAAAPEVSQNKEVGSLSIGFVYENDYKKVSWMEGNGKRSMCKVSEEHLKFLDAVREMLYPLLHPTLQIVIDETVRVNILCGAQTLAHTDSFRGNTPNALYIVKQQGIEPGYLCYDTFPKFKYSVVKLWGKHR